MISPGFTRQQERAERRSTFNNDSFRVAWYARQGRALEALHRWRQNQRIWPKGKVMGAHNRLNNSSKD
jgi:hypothetical protein